MRAALALAAAVLLAAGCGGEDERVDLPLGKQVAATATLTPTVHLFAEPVVAGIDVVVDRDHLDPARVRVAAKFLPYDVKETVKDTVERGRFTLVRHRFLLRCLRIACVPEVLPGAGGESESGRGERRAFALPAVRVLYDEPGGGDPRTLTRAPWPELVSVSRIKESDVPSFGFVFKTSVTPLPEPDFRVSPTVLGAGLLAGALVLLALPVGLGASWLRRRRPPPAADGEVELTPLERALRLVEWARERENGAERREALEALAVELEVVERGVLAADARMLAWSPGAPSPEAADRFVQLVRSEHDA